MAEKEKPMKPKFKTRWQDGRLVPIAVEGGDDVEFTIDNAGGPIVVMVWVRGTLIYRDETYFYVGPV